MNILVTGANGQLGNEMRIVSKGSKDRYIFTDVCDERSDSIEMLHKLAGEDIDTTTTKLDITNLDAVREMVKENDVKVIVNCAAWTNVDGAEDPEKRELVELLNAKAPENLAIAMKEVGGLLYISLQIMSLVAIHTTLLAKKTKKVLQQVFMV